ncbi:MAG: hypothetical protein MSS80_07700 [Mollicutes bacterium]|nr:hypothetical protein [Mollicutes bacterium]
MAIQYDLNYMKELFKSKGYKLLNNEYKRVKDNANFICLKHPEIGVQTTRFENATLAKKQCKVCKNEEIKNREQYRIKLREQTFIKICHENNWIYQGCNAINGMTYIYYICKKHIKNGVQKIRTDHLSNGVKCPYCNISKGEERIEKFLIVKNIEYQREYIFKDCKNKEALRFDFYLPEYNLAIEYQGIQHYKSIEYMGGKTRYDRQLKNDNIKRKYCKEKGIKLFEIPYTEFNNIENVMNNILETLETAGV